MCCAFSCPTYPCPTKRKLSPFLFLVWSLQVQVRVRMPGSFGSMRRSSSGYSPILPLSHSGKKKGTSIPNWCATLLHSLSVPLDKAQTDCCCAPSCFRTVALLLISSCTCYGLIAYAYGRRSGGNVGDDEGVQNLADSTNRGIEKGSVCIVCAYEHAASMHA